MSGSANRWVLRLSTEGADQVIRDLRAAATESAAAGRAYDALIKAQPQLATGAERAEQALRQNVDAMRGMRGELGLVSAAVDGAAGSFGRFGSALTSPAAAIAALSAGAAAGVASIARLGDEYTTTMNKLRAATGSLGAAQAVYSQLVALSQQTGASISESAGAFVRFSVAARAIGATNGEVLQLTRTIQQAGLISGASTQEAAAGVQQLGQALASGTLQGDELRSILENMPTLAEALARELGVSIGQLRTMGSEGQLTSDRVFQALLRASENINKQFTELTPTMGRAFGILGQSMVEFVGKLDQALGLSQAIARAATAAASAVRGASSGVTPRSPAEQADFDVAQARERMARLETELGSLNGEPGIYAAPRRGTISRAMQEAAAQAQSRETRIAELRQRIEAENAVIREGMERRNQVHSEADDIRQAEEAAAAARRAAAARTAQTTAFNATRDGLDRERKLRADHAAQITAINAGLTNGSTDAAGADRLRRMANDELTDGLRALASAARGRIETDEDLVQVSRIVADIERDRLALIREGETVTQSVRTQAEKYAEELGRLNNLLSAGAITQETYNRAVAAADPAVRAATEAAQKIEQENTRMTDRVTGMFGDAFARVFEGTGDGFKSLMQSFRRAAISTFATIAAQAVIRPIIAPIVSGLGLGGLTSASGLSSIFGGSTAQAAGVPQPTTGSGIVGQAGMLGSAASLYRSVTNFNPGAAMAPGYSFNTGLGFADGLLNTPLTGAPTFGASTIAPGSLALGSEPAAYVGNSLNSMGGGLSLGSAGAGALGIAGGAYGIYSGLQKGGIGGSLQVAGGALSAGLSVAAMAGMSLGPPGWIAAAALAIAGALAPGQKASGKGQESRINLNSGAQTYNGLGGDRYSQGNRDSAEASVESIAALARQVGDRLGGARIGGDIAVGVTSSRGSGAGTLYLDIHGQKAQFANDEAGSKQLAERAAQLILEEFKSQPGVLSGDYAGIARGSSSLESLSSNLDWYEGVYKALTKSAEAASAYSQQLTAATKPYDDAIGKARELGLAEDALTRERDKATAQLEEARAATLTMADLTLQQRSIAAGLGGGDTYALSMRLAEQQATMAAKSELEQFQQAMKDAGATTQEVTALVERLTTVQGAEAAQRREMADLQRVEGLQGITNALLERAGKAGFAIDRVALEESQAALEAASRLRDLQAQLRGLGASAEQIADLSGVLTRSFTAEAEQRAALRVSADGATASVGTLAKVVDQLGVNASGLDLYERALRAGSPTADATWLAESRAAILNERDFKGLRQSLLEMGATAQEVASQVEMLTYVQDLEAKQRLRGRFETARDAYVSALSSEIGTREQSVSALRQNTDALRNVAEGLRSYVAGIKLDATLSPLTLQQRLDEARAQYDAALAGAQTGTPADRARQAGLLSSLGNTRLGLASSFYAPGTAAYVAEFEKVSSGLTSLADQIGISASVEELSLRAQEASLTVLKDQLKEAQAAGETARQTLDALRQGFLNAANAAGIRVSATSASLVPWGTGARPYGTTNNLSPEDAARTPEGRYFAARPDVAAAVNRGEFKSAYDHYMQFGSSEGMAWGNDPRPVGNHGARASGEVIFGGSVTMGESLNASSVNALYQQYLGRDAEPGIAQVWMGQQMRGFDLAAALEQSAEFQSRLAQVRGYADGGLTGTGWAMVGERGPELVDFATPARVYTADQTRSAMRGGSDQALLAEVKALRDIVKHLCAVTAQGSMAVVGAVDGQTGFLVDATAPRMPVPA